LAACDPSGRGPAKWLTRGLPLAPWLCGGGEGGRFAFSSAAEHCVAPLVYSAAFEGSNSAAWKRSEKKRKEVEKEGKIKKEEVLKKKSEMR